MHTLRNSFTILLVTLTLIAFAQPTLFCQTINVSDAIKKKLNLEENAPTKQDSLYQSHIRIANKYYDNAEYGKASTAYALAFSYEKGETRAQQRLFAAAANCMVDNEDGVKEHLFAMLPVSTKRDMKRILVNYAIFNKYKHNHWWQELESKLDERLRQLIAHHKNLKIFKKGRNLAYRAIRINAEGDTLANTFVTMKPDGTGWGDEAASLQSQVVYDYEYSSQDSIDHYYELDKVVTPEFWIKTDTTGVIENEEKVWIHPIRNNEFFKTEVAPFPTVLFPISDTLMKKHNPKIYILRNWGIYSDSVTESTYNYHGKELRAYLEDQDIECHKFEAQSFNNFHGISQLIYYYHEDLGFLEMHYNTYDGDTIWFVLDKITK